MLSGNGRHRRPRQAPALLVAAGVTGSAIAIPLLGATSASAADGTVWDKVAECESGGSWSTDEGNGRYGGLQLTQDDWEQYGGLDYAPRPDLASRSQQISVAQAVLADQGTKPWGTCAVLNGLTPKNGLADLDTGVEGDSPSEVSGSSGLLDSPGSSSSSNSSDSPGSSNSSDATDGPSSSSSESPSASSESPRDSSSSPSSSPSSSSKADKSAKPDASPDAKASKSPDSSPVETSDGDNQDNWVQDVGAWSLVDTSALTGEEAGAGRHRGPSADESEAADPAAETSGRHASYKVRAGDTLASIADSLDLDGGWRALYDANAGAIGGDANDIAPGQTLDVPVE
ncbi:transglycosylase family protein [Streptomyces sp. Marseille-Q5077]|uniref:transglycosylase family protein n=1 Tax=Streptomyces sp. Marseille-Q5077 TaxID=3418995 RepID=UPI003D05135D